MGGKKKKPCQASFATQDESEGEKGPNFRGKKRLQQGSVEKNQREKKGQSKKKGGSARRAHHKIREREGGGREGKRLRKNMETLGKKDLKTHRV